MMKRVSVTIYMIFYRLVFIFITSALNNLGHALLVGFVFFWLSLQYLLN